MILSLAFMLGWFWSIYHGFLLCTHATEGQKFIENDNHPQQDEEKQLIEPNNEMQVPEASEDIIEREVKEKDKDEQK